MGSERWIPKKPAYRAGIYKEIESVPEHRRLRNYQTRFEGYDCWWEYLESNDLIDPSDSRGHKLTIERHERRWKKFIESQGRHHALCSPQDASEYATHLFDDHDLSMATAVGYWCQIERFYRWMFHRTDFPHSYHPFVMAAIHDENCHEIWMEEMTQEEP
jgi:hypothetical protein